MRTATLATLIGGIVLALGLGIIPRTPAGEDEPRPSYFPDREVPYRDRTRPFAVDVLVDGQPLPQYPDHGRRYVEARKGAEYELRITNPLAERVGLALSVDGLNTIDARRTTAWEASKWVILPHQTITLRGWQVSRERARRFTFTTERDSYAARLGHGGDLGLIAATFYRERGHVTPITPRTDEFSRSEPLGRAGLDAPRASLRSESEAGASDHRWSSRPVEEHAATGIGRSVPYEVRSIDMDLEPNPIAEVTLRYEYRPALMRLGVLPRFSPEPDDRRFCPEPDGRP